MKAEQLPLVLTVSRIVIGPTILVVALVKAPPLLLAALLVAGILSDIFDGILARRMKIVTADLRVADSKADGVYTICLIIAICLRIYI